MSSLADASACTYFPPDDAHDSAYERRPPRSPCLRTVGDAKEDFNAKWLLPCPTTGTALDVGTQRTDVMGNSCGNRQLVPSGRKLSTVSTCPPPHSRRLSALLLQRERLCLFGYAEHVAESRRGGLLPPEMRRKGTKTLRESREDGFTPHGNERTAS